MVHGDECPCGGCWAKREKHEEIVRQMQFRCNGCRVGQPHDGHSHTETQDLPYTMCGAQDLRQEIDRLRAAGEFLARHYPSCDCPACKDRGKRV